LLEQLAVQIQTVGAAKDSQTRLMERCLVYVITIWYVGQVAEQYIGL
jgi:hypothetical protein